MKYSDLVKVDLYPFQKEGVRWALMNPYCIIGFTMGLGKTLVALTVAFLKSKKTLIVVPAYLQQNWADEIEKFAVSKKKVLIVKKVIGEKEVRDHDIFIVSYASFIKVGRVFRFFDMLICDECQYLKTPGTKRTKEIHRYAYEHRPKRAVFLSGPPGTKGVPDFWSLLKLCWYGGKFPQFDRWASSAWRFADHFCHREYVFKTKFKHVGIRNRPELARLVRNIYIRKRSSEVLDLPAVVNNEIRLSSKNKLDKELLDAWNNFQKKEGEKLAYASVKERSAAYKVDATIRHAQSIIDNGLKVVIVSCHVDPVQKIAEKLKNVAVITGKTSADRRHEIIKKLSKGEFDGLVATADSIKTGFNITCCNQMILNDLPWDPTTLLQVRKRIHRIGQESTCFYHYILSSNIDYRIYSQVLEKIETLKGVLNV